MLAAGGTRELAPAARDPGEPALAAGKTEEPAPAAGDPVGGEKRES